MFDCFTYTEKEKTINLVVMASSSWVCEAKKGGK